MLKKHSDVRNKEDSNATLHTLVSVRFEKSVGTSQTFFSENAEQIAQACWAMAQRFHQGGRLLAVGRGARASDAQHVSVEFVHPVIVGKRALPAIALTNDSVLLTGRMNGDRAGSRIEHQLTLIARPQDIVLGFCMGSADAETLSALEIARSMGLLTLCMDCRDVKRYNKSCLDDIQLDYHFMVVDDDPLVIQETYETLYHILWELVHVFFEHEGLLA